MGVRPPLAPRVTTFFLVLLEGVRRIFLPLEQSQMISSVLVMSSRVGFQRWQQLHFRQDCKVSCSWFEAKSYWRRLTTSVSRSSTCLLRLVQPVQSIFSESLEHRRLSVLYPSKFFESLSKLTRRAASQHR